MAKTVLELQQFQIRKTEELKEIFDKFRSDQLDEEGKVKYDMPATVLSEIEDRNNELNTIGSEIAYAKAYEARITNDARLEDLKGIDRTTPRPASGSTAQSDFSARNPQYQGKSLGEIVCGSNEYKFRNTGNKHFGFASDDVDFKTLISIGAGFTPPNYRTTEVVDYANRTPVVADLIPTTPTSLQVVKWMENTTYTNAAASVSEGGAKPESAFVWAEKSSTVEKIAHWVPVTQEQVDDVPAMMSLINRDLVLGLQLKEEDLLLNGTGASPQMLGFLQAPSVQSQAKSTDDAADAILKAFTLVRWTGYAEPDGVVINPTDWQNIRLLRTTDGQYIFGNPSTPGEMMLWGKRVIVTNAISAGTALTGDFTKYSQIYRKMGIRVDVADQHSTYWVNNLLAVRAEMREALCIKRQAAFCKVTGL